MRLQLALNVRNIEEVVAYYAKPFGVQPQQTAPRICQFCHRATASAISSV